MARRLADVHGHQRLDWVMLLDPVATEAMACWQGLGHRVVAPHQGRDGLVVGQRLLSDGLSVELLSDRGQAMLLRLVISAGACCPGPRPSGRCRIKAAPPMSMAPGLDFSPIAPSDAG